MKMCLEYSKTPDTYVAKKFADMFVYVCSSQTMKVEALM